MTIEIYNWADVAELPGAQWNTLLLGNGASIALHAGFNYGTLHAVAAAAGKLRTSGPVFNRLGTTNFELVLLACWHAAVVNSALGSPTLAIDSAYHEVRDGLIHAVRQTHCAPPSIFAELTKIGNYCSTFETVVTFNYDLTIYWAMLEFNSSNGNWFKDGFLHGLFESDWSRLRTPRNAKGATMVFYAHGSLMLARDIFGRECKLAATQASAGWQTALLNTVTSTWAKGTHVPLFVSEGTSAEKLQAINRSAYLRTVYTDVLSNVGKNAVVYGLSFAVNDDHVVDALSRNPPDVLAVSVFGGLSPVNQQSFCHSVLSTLGPRLPRTQLVFFDSTTPGCWCN